MTNFFLSRWIFLLLVLICLASPAVATAQSARTLTGDSVEGSQSPFRGSIIAYEHAGTVLSAFPGAEPRWNPYYAHQLSFRPEFHLKGIPLYFRANFALSQELTLSDVTTYRHELVWSDLNLEAVTPGWVEPSTKIRIGGSLRFTAPVSKASWAQTLNLGVSPALTVTRPFPVLKGLVVGYGARFAGFWNRSTTALLDGPRIPCGDPDSALCRRLSHAGSRNPAWSISHGPVLVLMATESLAFTATYNHYYTRLHKLTPASVPALTGEVELDEGNGVNGRFSNLTVVDATWRFTRELSLAAGVLTASSQLGLDSSYRNPLFNRFTMAYVDILVDVERLVSRFTRRTPRQTPGQDSAQDLLDAGRELERGSVAEEGSFDSGDSAEPSGLEEAESSDSEEAADTQGSEEEGVSAEQEGGDGSQGPAESTESAGSNESSEPSESAGFSESAESYKSLESHESAGTSGSAGTSESTGLSESAGVFETPHSEKAEVFTEFAELFAKLKESAESSQKDLLRRKS